MKPGRKPKNVTVKLPKTAATTIAEALEAEPCSPPVAPTLCQLLSDLEITLHNLRAYRDGVLERL